MRSNTSRLVFGIIFTISLITASASCKTIAEKNDHQGKLNIIGLSLLPPSGQGWRYQKVHPGRIEFGKIGLNKHQSFLASAFIHKIPISSSDEDFLTKISKERWGGEDKDGSRFKDLLREEKISHEKDDVCIRYHSKYEDHQSKYLSKEIPYYVVEDIGLICRYPGKTDIGVSIGISQRAEPHKLLNDFESLANDFLSNAAFEPLPAE